MSRRQEPTVLARGQPGPAAPPPPRAGPQAAAAAGRDGAEVCVFTHGKDNIFIPARNSAEEFGKTGSVIGLP